MAVPQQVSKPAGSNGDRRTHIVVDVGGTTLRIGRFDAAHGVVTLVRRVPVDGMALHPTDPIAVLQHRVLDQIVGAVAVEIGNAAPAAIGVAFAGPISADGLVLGAPTIWGGPAEPFPLLRLLQERLTPPIVVVNDLTAAVWRYVTPDTAPFCLFTVSSGIGNKVYRNGEVLLDPDGHGGELGHWRCSTDPQAPMCDCGERGHLGAIASGRGVLAQARLAAQRDPGGYRVSLLARLCGPAAEDIHNPGLAAAIRDGDPFATNVLRVGLVNLAQAITALFTGIGIRHVVIVGGFAVAVGPRYVELLTDEVRQHGCFGLSATETDAMISLGVDDDDHCLIGMGRLLEYQIGSPPNPGSTVAPGATVSREKQMGRLA